MAKSHHPLRLLATLFTIAVIESQAFSETLPQSYQKLNGQKLTHLHFYFHDVVSGQNPTAVTVAGAASSSTSSPFFGSVAVLDDLLTEGPDPNSKFVGRAQGMTASASQSEVALLMNINLVFMEGEFNGSTLSLFGRNTILSAVREMPIVGGTGAFRFARGYAQAKTHTFNITSGNAVVEYNAYVFVENATDLTPSTSSFGSSSSSNQINVLLIQFLFVLNMLILSFVS